MKYDTVIIGGGPAGLTAGIYASRDGLKTLIIAGQPSGGQLTLTTDVENYPGFPNGVLGPELINNFKIQATKFGAELIEENVKNISGSFEGSFTVETTSGSYIGRTVIIASGASAKWLELPNEQKLIGKGVSACATCDGFFFKNLNNVMLRWVLQENGVAKENGVINTISLQPQEENNFKLAIKTVYKAAVSDRPIQFQRFF
jgi:thioredoxin reductase (NADPH)